MATGYRRRRRRNDHNVDDWLMTYADMITLLLCFFAIFLSISTPRDEQMQTARQKVMEEFASADALANMNQDVGERPPSDIPFNALPSIIGEFNQGNGQDVFGNKKGSGESDDPNEANLAREQQIEKKNNSNKNNKKQLEGDRIKVLEMPSAAFFASGSAQLSEEGAKLLQAVIDKDLKATGMEEYQITVEGHTDDAPIKTFQFPSNWELSTARAAAVVRFFIEHGVPAQRLRAAGYADVFPKAPNRDSVGQAIPDNQAQNRRVIIKLEKIEKDE